MDERIELELKLLRQPFPDLRYENRWVFIPGYVMPDGWGANSINTSFHIRDGFPGVSPYGIYVPAGLRFKGELPSSFADIAKTQPPFPGKWGMFSWEAEQWFATADVISGHNLLTWVRGFEKRFREGR